MQKLTLNITYYLLRSMNLGLSRFMRLSWKTQTNIGPYENSFLFKFAHSKWMKSLYLLRYLLLAEVLEVRVVKVHEGVLEGSDKHGTILKQFLIQSCTCKMDKNLAFV